MAYIAATMTRTPSQSTADATRFGCNVVTFRWFTFGAACLVVLVLAHLIVALGKGPGPAICGTLVTSVISQFAMSPYDDWHGFAFGAAVLITFDVLPLSILARRFASNRIPQ
jgi:hypothetical protein